MAANIEKCRPSIPPLKASARRHTDNYNSEGSVSKERTKLPLIALSPEEVAARRRADTKPDTERSQRARKSSVNSAPFEASTQRNRTVQRRSTSGSAENVEEEAIATRRSSKSMRSKEPREQRWKRKLSFADISFGQCVERSKALLLNEGHRFDAADLDVWEAMFLDEPADEFKALRCRTLTWWVRVFNHWQELKGEGPEEVAPEYVSGSELDHILKISQADLHKVFRLFDLQNWNYVETNGSTKANLDHIRIPMFPLMTLGVLLSPLITSRNKIQFLFGLYDIDDSGGLDENEFMAFGTSFLRGASFVFQAPSASPDYLVKAFGMLYKRLSREAGRRIKQMAAGTRSESQKAAIMQAIKAKAEQGFCPASPMARSVTGSRRKLPQVIPYKVLEDSFIGDKSTEEPLFLFAKLAMLRFCPDRESGNVFTDEFPDFKLSHTALVPVLPEGERLHHDDLPTRPQAVFVKHILKKMDRPTETELHRAMAASPLFQSVGTNIQMKLIMAFKERDIPIRRRDAYISLMRALYPKAQPKHLRMFEQWCEEYDDLSGLQACAKEASAALEDFKAETRKPAIPLKELDLIKAEFKKMDRENLGSVEIGEVAVYFGFDRVEDIVSRYDVDCDGFISEAEFCKMMCPANYRLPDMDVKGQQLLGAILEQIEATETTGYTTAKAKFESNGSHEDVCFSVSSYRSCLPEVPEDVWQDWHNVFAAFDVNHDGKVQFSDLASARIVSEDVVRYVLKQINPEDADSFTLQGFLEVMLKTFGYKRSDPMSPLTSP